MIENHVKVCDQCSAKFFTTTADRIVCSGYEDAYFCSPYCQALWLTEQFAEIEEMVYED